MAERIDRLEKFTTAKTKTEDMGQTVVELMTMAENSRRGHEKRWYDNNFFDDGYHFRYLSRSTGKIIDLSQKSSIYTPLRVIPKASKQIRGIVNLLTQPDFVPVFVPERVRQDSYTDPQEFEKVWKQTKHQAKMRGYWVRKEWETQEIQDWKAPFLAMLTAKHGIAYLQVYPDAQEERIKSQVYDAFDIYLLGSLTELEKSPFIIKAVPKLISEIKANKFFDQDQLNKISPDNRFANSEIKESYLNARFGREGGHDSAATLILKEAYIKEYLNSDNMAKIRKQKDGGKILQDRKEGDSVFRQVFVAGNVWLRDVYTDLPDYPFVDLRFEPGPLYQVPLLERFKSTNKSLDSVISRLERYTHTMTVGTWLKRRGEQWGINNLAGGQVIEYDTTPPVQGQMASIPGHFFGFINFLNEVIEEQGVTTTTLGKIPKGVRAGKAIESLKASEYSAQSLALKQMARIMKRISRKMLEIADAYYVTPKEVSYMQGGEPVFFDVIGQRGMEGREELKIQVPEGVVPLRKGDDFKIEVQMGMGFTLEGRQEKMLQLGEYMRDLARENLMTPEAVKVVLQRLLETFEFGATAEFMEAMENLGEQSGLTDQQLQQMKVAMIEVEKDLQGYHSQQTKIDVAEVLKDVKAAEGEGAKKAPKREIHTTSTVEEDGLGGTKRKREVETVEKEGE